MEKETACRPIMKNIKIIALLTLFGAVMLGNLGGWELKGADEPRYAQIAREMRETGQYIVPHLNAEIYPDKPPLFFWLMALAAVPSGDVSAFEARLPRSLPGLASFCSPICLQPGFLIPAQGCLRPGCFSAASSFSAPPPAPILTRYWHSGQRLACCFFISAIPVRKGETIYARGLCRHGRCAAHERVPWGWSFRLRPCCFLSWPEKSSAG